MPLTIPSSYDTLIDYHLGEKEHLPPLKKTLCLHIPLLFFSLAGFLYAPAAAKYHDDDTRSALDVTGTCFDAIVILYVSTEIFFRNHIGLQFVPAKLNEIVAPPLSFNAFMRESGIILVGAFYSAIPFVTTSIKDRFDIAEGLFIAFIVYIAIANIILHFLPVKLTLEHEIYGAPLRALNRARLWLFCRQKTASQKMLEKERLRLKKAKETLAARINGAKEFFLMALIQSPGEINHVLLDEYENKPTANEKFDMLMSYEPGPSSTPNWVVNCSRFLTAFIVVISCAGYLANPYVVFNDWLNCWWAAGLLAFAPDYFLGVLLAYFGDLYGQRIVSNLSIYDKNVKNIPFEVKLFPKTMTLLFAINAFAMIFSAAAAKQLVDEAYADILSSGLITTLKVFVQIGMALLTWYAPLDFELFMLNQVTQHTGSKAASKLAKTKSRIEGLARDCTRLTDFAISEFVDMDTNDQSGDEEDPNPPCCPFLQGFFKNERTRNQSTNSAQVSLNNLLDSNAHYTRVGGGSPSRK